MREAIGLGASGKADDSTIPGLVRQDRQLAAVRRRSHGIGNRCHVHFFGAIN